MPGNDNRLAPTGAAQALCDSEGALGVALVVFYEGTRYTTAWAGADSSRANAMRIFTEEVERLIVPESPRDRGEVGPGPVVGQPPGQDGEQREEG